MITVSPSKKKFSSSKFAPANSLAAILALFLTYPDKRFSIRMLANNLKIGNCERKLMALRKEGVEFNMRRRKAGHKKYRIVDKNKSLVVYFKINVPPVKARAQK